MRTQEVIHVIMQYTFVSSKTIYTRTHTNSTVSFLQLHCEYSHLSLKDSIFPCRDHERWASAAL